ncbi:MAG: galactokinase [Bacteroidales bacterium]|nr:galactokinase [Bacteroidales bacterium]
MNLNQLKSAFHDRYPGGVDQLLIAFAPGRVNLIGEHTDYNGGFVLPCAISFGTWLLMRKNNDNLLRLASGNFDLSAEIPIEKVNQKNEVSWVNYPLGVINELIELGLNLSGLDLFFYGNIPSGAGLSSSASIEVVTAAALNQLYGLNLNLVDLVVLSQRAENRFVGVNCGIMDQFAVGLSKKGHALFLNCHSLNYELPPLNLGTYRIAIANTGKKRQLAESKYNERVSECDKAVEYISKVKPIGSLGELSYQEFVDLSHIIPDIIIRKRAKYVVSENQRVMDAVNALAKGNLRLFGSLMNASHNSLRFDYEVTGEELDVIVEEARNVEGVLGARMTGAGFGGCSVNIVAGSQLENFISQVGENYFKKTELHAEFYISETGDGVKIVEY